jgi:hypothetical protein
LFSDVVINKTNNKRKAKEKINERKNLIVLKVFVDSIHKKTYL